MRSPADIVPNVLLGEPVGSVQPLERALESGWPAKRERTYQVLLGFSPGALMPGDEQDTLPDPLSDF